MWRKLFCGVARFPSDGGAGFLIGGFAQKMFELRSKNTATAFANAVAPPQLTELRCLRSCWVWFLWVDIVEFTNCLKVLSFEWLCYGRSRTPWLRHSWRSCGVRDFFESFLLRCIMVECGIFIFCRVCNKIIISIKAQPMTWIEGWDSIMTVTLLHHASTGRIVWFTMKHILMNSRPACARVPWKRTATSLLHYCAEYVKVWILKLIQTVD